MTLKNGFNKCLLFVLSANDEKIETWTLDLFAAKENPNGEGIVRLANRVAV